MKSSCEPWELGTWCHAEWTQGNLGEIIHRLHLGSWGRGQNASEVRYWEGIVWVIISSSPEGRGEESLGKS
jgi:hypothetical protein